MIALLVLHGCLINTELYERRRAELAEDCEETAWFVDADGDGFGASEGTSESSCERPPGRVDNALDCDDATAAAHPGGTEVPYNGVDDDCAGGDVVDADGDGHDSEEAGGADCDDLDPEVYPDATEDWANGITDNDCDGEREAVVLTFGADAWVGASAGEQAGRRVGALGDVTGDGLAEYLVGAVYAGGAHVDGGAVYLVEGGSADGDLAAANTLLPGGEAWYLPQVIVGGPDIDDDGLPDLVATATGYGAFTGAAFLVSGATFAANHTLALPEAAIAQVSGDVPGELAGTGAAFVGDVVGDGGEYLAVTSLLASGGAVNAGAVGVVDARTLGSARVSDGEIVAYGPYAEAAMGNLVAPAGDVDGDGIADYLVTVTYGDLAYVVPGGVAAPSLPADAIFRLTGTGAGEVGWVEMLGDVDGDGVSDLAYIHELEEVRVFTGLDAQPVRTVADHQATIELGEGALAYDLLDLGDLDGDGLDETYVPLQWSPGLETSVAAVVFGEQLGFRATVAVADAALTAVSTRTNGRFGYRVARSADVDGDGADDIVVGGYSDAAGGTDAGGALTIPVPR